MLQSCMNGEELVLRVLVAGDDQEVAAEVCGLIAALRGARVEVDRERSFAAALAAISGAAHAFCFIGESLDGGTGLELMRAVSAVSATTPLIYVTRAEDRSRCAEAMEAGAADYLVLGQTTEPLLERTIRYVMEKRHLQEELGMLLHAADEADKAKAEFMANMSHEVKTPLNAIIGLLDVVLESSLGQDQRENLMLARFSADSLLLLMNGLIDASNLSTGRLSFNNRGFSLRQTVSRTVHAVKKGAEQKQIRLLSHVADGVPEFLYGDPERLSQVIAHLMSNAVKFTDAGEVSLSVQCSGDDPGVVLHWTVRDTGPGIPKERIDQMFQLFTQLNGSSTRRHGGVGIGLGLVRQLVTLLGGRIWVESEVGRGTAFHFTTVFGCRAAVGEPRREDACGTSDGGSCAPGLEDAAESRGRIGLFIRDSKACLDDLRHGCSAKDEPRIEQRASQLKGLASAAGLTDVADEAFRVQLAARRSDLDGAAALVDQLAKQLARLDAGGTFNEDADLVSLGGSIRPD